MQQFSDEDEAVRWANGVKYGLSSSVWTKDHGRAMRMSRRLDFGCVWINTHIPIVAEMPHGGFKHSGYGKDLSMYGLEDYTRIKHVMTNIWRAEHEDPAGRRRRRRFGASRHRGAARLLRGDRGGRLRPSPSAERAAAEVDDPRFTAAQVDASERRRPSRPCARSTGARTS